MCADPSLSTNTSYKPCRHLLPVCRGPLGKGGGAALCYRERNEPKGDSFWPCLSHSTPPPSPHQRQQTKGSNIDPHPLTTSSSLTTFLPVFRAILFPLLVLTWLTHPTNQQALRYHCQAGRHGRHGRVDQSAGPHGRCWSAGGLAELAGWPKSLQLHCIQ